MKYLRDIEKSPKLCLFNSLVPEMKLLNIIFIAILLQTFMGGAFASVEEPTEVDADEEKCFEEEDRTSLMGGWYLVEPYQFNQLTPGGLKLTGMDVELLGAIAQKLGMEIKYEHVAWAQQQKDLQEGKRDVLIGATFTLERAKYAYFSKPYRFEENSLFVKEFSPKTLTFNTIPELLAQARLQNFRLGVIDGFVYGDPLINSFINDSAQEDIVYKYKDTLRCLQALIRGEIDGFIADRVVVAATILSRKASNIKEIPLDVKVPIHLMFSKKTVPIETVNRFNQKIDKLVNTVEYKDIIKVYLYPVLLMQTMEADWFYIIGLIGTIAFAVSGIAIAAKENATLFGTFLLAMFPSIGGGIMRDVILNRDAIGIFLTPTYMYYIVIVVLVGFATVRLLEYYNTHTDEDSLIRKFWDNLLLICDALGQAAFIVTGVSIVIMAKIEPIELWGPFFAFLTSNGGGILRDLIRKERNISCLSDEVNAELAVIWGFIFSLFLDKNAYNPTPDSIQHFVIFITAGAFLSRLMVVYFKVPNLKFRRDNVRPPV